MYLDIGEHGWFYFFLSVPLLMGLHEVYFYWTHRWLHHPWWFKRVHRVHHESVNPTPWAVFSFHPVEAVIQAVVLPLLILVVLVPGGTGVFDDYDDHRGAQSHRL
ncbi:MAG: sterol desaturase family protein [Bdellovibrionota bacterium]